MKKSEKKMILLLIAITIIVIAILGFTKKSDKNSRKSENIEQIAKDVGIDINEETYAGKKIYEQDKNLVIENTDGSKTIETITQEKPELEKTSEEEKKQYEITDVNVDIRGNRTSITGMVKNNSKKDHKISIGAKFYSNENRVKGTGNMVINKIKAGERQRFEIVIMGNMQGFTHKEEVEFIN